MASKAYIERKEKMSGRTAFQKIIDQHCVEKMSDGSMVLKLDRVWGHEITLPNAILDAKERQCDVVFNPNKIKTMIDHVNPAKDTASAVQGQIVRNWSHEHDTEFLDVGRNGVCHAIIPEKGWIKPGEIGIMGDSHTGTHGAFCAFTAGVGTTELECGIITGLWVCPPQKVIRVNFEGFLPANVYSKDLILALINKIGVKGATNAVLEFGGEVFYDLSMEARMTITNMAVEAGATSGMMMVDEKVYDYLQLEGELDRWECWNSDEDAVYDRVIEIDVSEMVPVMTIGYSPGDVVKVKDFRANLMSETLVKVSSREVVSQSLIATNAVDQVYIGSCTNGRLEDLRIAAMIFRLLKDITGHGVAENIRCVIVPATQHIWDMAMEEGLFKIFSEAGCHISGPSCGACLGMSCGVIAPGEVCVSTTNRNFPGRMGKNGMVHLASPATAAITAVYGKVSEASVKLCEEVDELIKNFSAKILGSHTNWQDVLFATPDYNQLVPLFKEAKVKDFSGEVFNLPLINVDTDQIIPAKYLNEVDKKVFGQHCLEDCKISSEHRAKLWQSKIIVADENFGCGSSREHASWALEGAGIRCVIAPSFARIFKNSMFANGLLCITLSKKIIDSIFQSKTNYIRILWEHGIIEWGDQGAGFKLTDHQKNLIRSGGLVGVMVKLAAKLQKEGKL